MPHLKQAAGFPQKRTYVSDRNDDSALYMRIAARAAARMLSSVIGDIRRREQYAWTIPTCCCLKYDVAHTFDRARGSD
jgi:hypothetical protein